MEDTKTLLEAKNELKTKLREGKLVTCPCCNQKAKIYRRKISSNVAYGLIVLAKKYYGEFHLEKTLIELDLLKIVRSDFPKLRYWGLISAMEGTREDGSSRNGYYTITEAGRMFVMNKISMPKYVYIYNNKPLNKSGSSDRVKITDCLGEKYDYSEMMSLTDSI